MNVSQAELGQVTPSGDTLATASPSLVEKAEGLGRAAVMQEIIGPHLDAMMRPIYEPEIGANEKKLPSLEGEFPLRTLEHFFMRARLILQGRFRGSASQSQDYRQLLELNKERQDLLFYANDPWLNIGEAIATSISVPLTIASSISGLERPKEPSGHPRRNVGELTEIMGRESFHRILMRLTKGPNEFLGSGSDTFTQQDTPWFYSFKQGGIRLPMRNAFDMERGKVVGLSGAYALAAEQRRETLRERLPGRHQGNDTSGCPVRHGFEDADGNPQASLVLTGNEFTVAALQHAERIPYPVKER